MQNQRDPCEFRARYPGPALGQHPSEDAHIPRSPFLTGLSFNRYVWPAACHINMVTSSSMILFDSRRNLGIVRSHVTLLAGV